MSNEGMAQHNVTFNTCNTQHSNNKYEQIGRVLNRANQISGQLKMYKTHCENNYASVIKTRYSIFTYRSGNNDTKFFFMKSKFKVDLYSHQKVVAHASLLTQCNYAITCFTEISICLQMY